MGGMCTGHRKKLSFLPSVAGKALEETWRRTVREWMLPGQAGRRQTGGEAQQHEG